VTTTQKFKVVVQKPRGPSYDLGDEAYSLEREGLDPVGAAIVQVDASSTDEFLAEARDADALIARHRRLHAGIIEGLQKCIVIGCGSVGSDTVDVAAATRAGIVVTNVPDVFIDEVADHALMLILAAVRRLNVMERMARDGHWWDARRSPACRGSSVRRWG
jgi:D-3-phosphoglycerate dehydrogenase